MADLKQLSARSGLFRWFRDNADGTYAEEMSAGLRAWDATSLTWVKLLADHNSGALSVTGSGGGGGGAVTVADGADVAQGTTTDLSSANTVVGLLKNLKAALAATLTVGGTVNVGNSPTVDVSDRAARLLGVISASTNRLGSVRVVDSADADQTTAKGTQTSRFIGTQDAKDSGRVNIAWTAEFAFAQTAETLLTMTESRDGAATTTFTTKAVTSGKRLRITSVQIEVEGLGSGTAPQRAYLRCRFNTAGAATTGSPLQGVWGCVNNPAVVKTGTSFAADFPDGIEFLGDGTKTIAFSLETPDWVTTTATGRAKITITAFEY